MKTSELAAIASFCVLMGAGQILFKLAATRVASVDGTQAKLVVMLLSPHVWGAGVLYGVASLLWVLILTRVPLSIAYPLTTVTIVLVPMFSWFLFNDPINVRMVLGMLTIVAGVCLIAGAPR